MRREAETVLAAVVPEGELLVVCGYGAIRGESSGLGRVQLYEHASRQPADHVVIGITSHSVIFVPVRRVGLFRSKLRGDPPLEILARADVIVEVGTIEDFGGRRAVPVRFVRRDGSAHLVELYDDPAQWSSLPR